jgi:DNA polymerase-3 subunit epsilon
MKVTCIDFETANSFKGSICSVGITLIDGSNTVLSKTWLVKPNIRFVFTQANILIFRVLNH